MGTKTTLKTQTEVVQRVDSNDLEKFIKDVTGHTYEIVYSEGWSNDSDHRIAIDGKISNWHSKEWESFKKDGLGGLKLRAILEGLCSEGYLEVGTYLVQVCW